MEINIIEIKKSETLKFLAKSESTLDRRSNDGMLASNDQHSKPETKYSERQCLRSFSSSLTLQANMLECFTWITFTTHKTPSVRTGYSKISIQYG
jgi:hypothetical protein